MKPVDIPDNLYERLQEIADEFDETVNELAEDAIDAYIQGTDEARWARE